MSKLTDQRAKLIYANCKLFQKVFTISISFRKPQYRLPVWNGGIKIVQDNLILRNSKTTTTMFSTWFKMHDQTVLQLKPFWSALTWKKSKARIPSFRTYKPFLLYHCQFLVTLGAVETTEKSMTRPFPELRSFHHGWSKSVKKWSNQMFPTVSLYTPSRIFLSKFSALQQKFEIVYRL